MIQKVMYTGDMLEIEHKLNDKVTTIRRHVQGYLDLTDQEKQALWHEVAGEPLVEYKENVPIVGKWNTLGLAVKNLFKR